MPEVAVRKIFLDLRSAMEGFSSAAVTQGADLESQKVKIELDAEGLVTLSGEVVADEEISRAIIRFCRRTGILLETNCSCVDARMCCHCYALLRCFEQANASSMTATGVLDVSKHFYKHEVLANARRAVEEKMDSEQSATIDNSRQFEKADRWLKLLTADEKKSSRLQVSFHSLEEEFAEVVATFENEEGKRTALSPNRLKGDVSRALTGDQQLVAAALLGCCKTGEGKLKIASNQLAPLLTSFSKLEGVEVFIEEERVDWVPNSLSIAVVAEGNMFHLRGVVDGKPFLEGSILWGAPPLMVMGNTVYRLADHMSATTWQLIERLVVEGIPSELLETVAMRLDKEPLVSLVNWPRSSSQDSLRVKIEVDVAKGEMAAQMTFSYGNLSTVVLEAVLPQFGEGLQVARDLVREQEFLELLQQYAKNVGGRWYLDDHRFPAFYSEVMRTPPSDLTICLTDKLNSRIRPVDLHGEVSVSQQARGLFEVAFSCPDLPSPVPLASLRQALSQGHNCARLEDGSWGVFQEPPSIAVLDALEKSGADCYTTQHIKTSPWAIPWLERITDDVTVKTVCTQLATLSEGGVNDPKDAPKGFLGQLRPYQKEGLSWLTLLYQSGMHGLLADDMGLGKTVQTLALLHSLGQGPHLIICPRALIYNWLHEMKSFAPDLHGIPLVGTPEERAHALCSLEVKDVVVTSYAMASRDGDLLQRVDFGCIVLDEAQHIRNPVTNTAKACKTLSAQLRLALTGTPVENSLQDMWSIFDFLVPGLLGERSAFRSQYQNSESFKQLGQKLRPFVLRRTKQQVLDDLPELTRTVTRCELDDQQKILYRDVVEAFVSEMDALDQDRKLTRMHILAGLTRLKQLCCHPKLLGFDDVPSAKTELLQELLAEIVEGGNRVVIFSQYVQMLDLLAQQLIGQEIGYLQLDGSTRNPAQLVEEYNVTTNIPVLLASLKTGGTGLNITGADRVIHYDIWWNPAVENQATARVHRIGQRNAVIEYKLVAYGTIEEKIIDIQQNKLQIAQDLLEEGDRQSITDWKQVRELLDI